MSVLGGGHNMNFETESILGESQLALGEGMPFWQLQLPHCYAVMPFGHGEQYRYEIVPGGDDYLGVL